MRMGYFVVDRPGSLDELGAGSLHEWLKAQGVEFRGLHFHRNGTMTVVAPADTDEAALRAVIRRYVPAPAPKPAPRPGLHLGTVIERDGYGAVIELANGDRQPATLVTGLFATTGNQVVWSMIDGQALVLAVLP